MRLISSTTGKIPATALPNLVGFMFLESIFLANYARRFKAPTP